MEDGANGIVIPFLMVYGVFIPPIIVLPTSVEITPSDLTGCRSLRICACEPRDGRDDGKVTERWATSTKTWRADSHWLR